MDKLCIRVYLMLLIISTSFVSGCSVVDLTKLVLEVANANYEREKMKLPPSKYFKPYGQAKLKSYDSVTLLENGKVLLLRQGFNKGSGEGEDEPPNAEVYNLETNTSHLIPNMNCQRLQISTVALTDKRIFIYGDIDYHQTTANCQKMAAEVFDPKTETFEPIYGERFLSGSSQEHLYLMPNGKVLSIGNGYDYSTRAIHPKAVYDKILEFDPKTKEFKHLGNLKISRLDPATVQVGTKIYLFGGIGLLKKDSSVTEDTRPIEVYDYGTHKSTIAGSMLSYRGNYSPLVLLTQDHKILIVGGNHSKNFRYNTDPKIELYDPITQQTNYITNLKLPKINPFGLLLPNGDVLFLGGTPDFRPASLPSEKRYLLIKNTVEYLNLKNNTVKPVDYFRCPQEKIYAYKGFLYCGVEYRAKLTNFKPNMKEVGIGDIDANQ